MPTLEKVLANMAIALVNNGLPVGVSRKSIVPGVILMIAFDDAPMEKVMVVENKDRQRPVNWKGELRLSVLARSSLEPFSVTTSQVVSVVSDDKAFCSILE